MVVYDSRPSAFNQLSTTTDWESWVSVMSVIAASGISAIDGAVGSAMVPSLDTAGRNAVNADGNAVIKGQLWRCDAPVSTPIPAPSSQNRIDRLVLRLTRGATTSATVVTPTVITGTPAGTPAIPPITQTPTGIWDIPISHWTSTAAGAITTLIDDRRLTNDTWHDMRPLSGGWIGTITNMTPPQYRFSDDGRYVEIAGYIQQGSAGNYNNVLMYTMPPRYCPQKVYRGYWWTITTPDLQLTETPLFQVWGNGNCSCYNLPSNIGGYQFCINGRYPLEDSSGFITS